MTGRFAVAGLTCLVTGGGRGIGRATALAFAGAGARVAIGDVDGPAAREAAAAVAAAGGRAGGLELDVTEPASVEAAVAAATDLGGGRLDVLVNNAGINVVRPALEVTPAEWQQVIAVNLTGAFLCARAAAARMRGRGGVILNLASIYGLVGPPLHPAAPYAASKAGLIGLTRALALEWAADGIRVNAVAPTHVRTELTRVRVDDPAWRARMLERTPLGRVLEPEDVVGALLFLASPAAAAITGHVLAVDAGWLAA